MENKRTAPFWCQQHYHTATVFTARNLVICWWCIHTCTSLKTELSYIHIYTYIYTVWMMNYEIPTKCCTNTLPENKLYVSSFWTGSISVGRSVMGRTSAAVDMTTLKTVTDVSLQCLGLGKKFCHASVQNCNVVQLAMLAINKNDSLQIHPTVPGCKTVQTKSLLRITKHDKNRANSGPQSLSGDVETILQQLVNSLAGQWIFLLHQRQ